jgi:hypothetical protein
MYRGAARRSGRRAGRRAARRTSRRVMRRRAFVAAPLVYRRPVIRRPLGTLLIMGATAGVAYKLGKREAQRIQEYTGVPPDQLSEEDLQAAMQDLDIQSQPLDAEDRQALAGAGTPPSGGPASTTPDQADYIAELGRLAELRDQGIISDEDFEAKKKQLLGL